MLIRAGVNNIQNCAPTMLYEQSEGIDKAMPCSQQAMREKWFIMFE